MYNDSLKAHDLVVTPNSNSSYLVDPSLNSRITAFLTKILNIPVHVRGYEYIKAIFVKCLESPDFEKEKITHVVYPFCSKMFDTSPERIERNIRHAILISYQRIKPEDFFELFGNLNKVPTNKCFILTVINYFKENYLA